MIETIKPGARFKLNDNRIFVPEQKALVYSIWDIEGFRRKRRGSTYHWEKIHSSYGNCNTVTNEGHNHLLNGTFRGATQITTWYVAVFSTDTTPSTATTYATPVFTETDKYDELTRPVYVGAESTAQSMSNILSKATYTVNDTVTIHGGALVGGGTAADTKKDTAGGGTMYAAAKFSSPGSYVSSDIFQVTIALTSAGA